MQQMVLYHLHKNIPVNSISRQFNPVHNLLFSLQSSLSISYHLHCLPKIHHVVENHVYAFLISFMNATGYGSLDGYHKAKQPELWSLKYFCVHEIHFQTGYHYKQYSLIKLNIFRRFYSESKNKINHKISVKT